MNSKSVLHLIPTFLSEENIICLGEELRNVLKNISIFYVEDLRSARRFLKKIHPQVVIDDLTFFIINEHEKHEIEKATSYFEKNIDVGLLSDCGCPAVADPGKELIALAHQLKIKIKPHVGPNSILLTLMASGFNGQQFSFHGYLPNKQPQLNQKISALEKQSQLNNETILFIETPYRNEQLKTTLLQNCHPDTQLCIAANLTSKEEIIITKKIKNWKNETLNFHKIPAMFAIYAGN